MRIALLSDIHGNPVALDAVLADIEAQGGVDTYWILGDFSAMGTTLKSAKICIKEASNGRIGDQAISTLDETMTLILETHVLDGHVPRT
jgi:predicted phosphodiesterase